MSKNSKIDIIAVVGPTASGKTKFSIDLAKKIDGEIISADSRLVYKGFDIGTAKPSKEGMGCIPHHMIDIVEPDFTYSAGLYKKSAQDIILDINKRGKTPIVVGGTGLYVDVLLKSFDLPLAEPDYDLRESLKSMDKDDLYDYLLSLDKTADIDKNDRKKIIRAIEIIKSTGKPLNEARGISENNYNVKWIGCNYERSVLYDRINKRVDLMIENGLIDETKNLINKYGPIPNIIDTIGYKEIYKYISGELSLDEAAELLKKNTRNYAKRQLTWFRRNEEIKWNVYPEKL